MNLGDPLQSATARRQAREAALQILFALDANPRPPAEVFEPFWAEHPAPARVRTFAEQLVLGVHINRKQLDESIGRLAENWRIARMAIVDRNVLRMGLHEMTAFPDIPAAVTINEAVDLANFFNSRESGRFVNGILDRARKDMGRNAHD